jgi:hypothetical protein
VGAVVRTDTHIRNSRSSLEQHPGTGTAVTVSRRARISHFLLHFVEMSAAMMIGMAVGMPIYRAIAGISSAEQYRLHPVPSVSAMALTMALPMAAWMLVRGHGWRNSAEMAAAMIVPAIPFIVLAGLHLISGTACRAYMPLSIVAMIGLMIYRWDMYSMPMRGLWRGHSRH